MKATKILSALFMMVLLSIMTLTAAVAAPSPTVDIPGIVVDFVKINGDQIDNGGVISEAFNRGEKIDIRLKVSSQNYPGATVPACVDDDGNPLHENGDPNQPMLVPDANGVCAQGEVGEFTPINDARDVENMAVLAWITGDEHFPLVEVSETFNLPQNTRETVDFDLEIPTILDLEDGDNYKLNLLVSARGAAVAQYQFDLKIRAPRHSVSIRDVVISPSQQVMAGRPFTVMTRVQNLGQKVEESIKVTASVPAFGIVSRNAEFIDEIDNDDDAVTSELIYLRVPQNAQPGIYDVLVEVSYDENTKKETATAQIQVVNPTFVAPGQASTPTQPEPARAKTVITVGPDVQDVVIGQGGAIYPVALTNEGQTSKTYVVAVSGAEAFATSQVSPSNVIVVDGGDTESVYVYVSARDDAQAGAHAFTLDIKSAEKTLQQIPLTANVVAAPEGADDNLRRGLEVGLIVLIVLLIVLGLIIAFTRSRKSDEDEALAGQTYY